MSESIAVHEIIKNSRQLIKFSLGTFKKFRFVDIRIFLKEDGKDPVPTPRGVTISPVLWSEFKRALTEVEEAMVEQKWLDPEDLTQE
jgi:hypothetical protein